MESVEIAIRDVNCPLLEPRAASVIIGRRDRPEERAFSLCIGAAEAHALQHELRGEETMRSQALHLAHCIAAVLGGRLKAARLVPSGRGVLSALIEVETPLGPVEVPIQPGQALALATRLGVPLLAAACLFPTQVVPTPLGQAVLDFLETLDFDENDQAPR